MEGEVKLNYKKILKFCGTIAIALLAVILGLRVAIFFLPFVIAYIISKIIERPVAFLTKKFKMSRVVAVIISMLFVIAIIGALSYWFVAALIKEVISLSSQTNYIFPAIYNTLSTQIGRFTFFYQNLDLSPELIEGIKNSLLSIVNTLLTSLSNLINAAGNIAVNTVVNLPNILIYIIITLLSTFFISSDKKFITESLEKHLPLSWLDKASKVSHDLFKALGGYLKAQGILITITFSELLIGFSIFGVKYALVLAIVIAIIDALPILGTGTVLIPWGIILLFTGQYKFGFCILGLYLFVLIIRQLIEPKIVGTQIGVYPLLTLLAMYTGVQLMGVFGLIVGPIVLVILKVILSGIYEKGALKDIFEVKGKKAN